MEEEHMKNHHERLVKYFLEGKSFEDENVKIRVEELMK